MLFRSIGTPHGHDPAPGVGCGGGCVFTAPRFGLHRFAPMPGMRPDTAEKKFGIDGPTFHAVRRLGALILPVARTVPNPPAEDMTQALPLVDADYNRHLAAAYTAARSARFEHGETP